ncbi:MAG: bifunctional phosphoribosylaminoimidazolecarboxamide formyltransferase/IMP cyclohydrolase [Proteobacteria bacterium]|nr:bifunctional phosphoribosylaminoimidazolecarboxamide formyltransferase/IMP cyclohydrolase [Pseudomonadota bacterium]
MVVVKRALISVTDKSGVVEFAGRLAATGTEILSTGGTGRALRQAGVPVTEVSAYTDSPEIMDGRVKTLHPRVHGGILMRSEREDEHALSGIGGKPIDLVAVNLYPFEATVARGAPPDEIVDNIDIGGPAMIRSAAKNSARVTVVVDPADYSQIAELASGGASPDASLRARLAAKAFAHTAAYDSAIADYLAARTGEDTPGRFPATLRLSLHKASELRYGENPHQRAAFYVERNAAPGCLASSQSLGAGGKELSFNNLVDCEAALDAVLEFERPAAVLVKHTNPCGVALAETLDEAYRTAREADPLSAFGGIVALNRGVDETTARVLAETFLECVIAPAYDEAALGVLRRKKSLRLLATGQRLPAEHQALQVKRVGGGLLLQDRDASAASDLQSARVATEREPNASERAALDFAWRVCKHVKSNAIVLAKGLCTVGVGAGQMSRVDSVQIATKKAAERAAGSVLASDAFFPFPDGVQAAAAAGVTAVVQPGGSKKDSDVIAAANQAGMAMLLTGVRHFRH